MKHNFWEERWQENKIGFHLPKVNPWLVKHLDRLNLKTNSRIFVPLCGKSQDLIYLAEKGFEVIGVEFIKQAVDDFFIEQKLTPKKESINGITKYSTGNISILHADYFDLDSEVLGNIDLVFDRASMVALPEDVRKKYPPHIKNIIGNCPQILLVTMDYPQDKISGPPFSVSNAEVEQAYQKQFYISLLDKHDLTVEDKFSGLDYATEKVWKLQAK
jgi:thiopurine S-methyltransferase